MEATTTMITKYFHRPQVPIFRGSGYDMDTGMGYGRKHWFLYPTFLKIYFSKQFLIFLCHTINIAQKIYVS